MKFDKFMEHCYKILCIVVACVVAFGSVVSCFNKPVKASAAGGGLLDVKEFVNRYQQNLVAIESALIHDFNNGTLDATTDLGKQALLNFAVQSLFNRQLTFYDPYFEFNTDWDERPINVDLSVGGCTGIFYDPNGGVHCSIINSYDSFQAIAAESDVFQIHVDWDNNYLPRELVAYESTDTSTSGGVSHVQIRRGAQYVPSGSTMKSRIYNSLNEGNSPNGWFIANSRSTKSGGTYYFRINLDSSPVTLYPNTQLSGTSMVLGSVGQEFQTEYNPVPSDEPWNYYNNYLLPYMYSNPNVNIYDIDQYIVFPDGYNRNDPTEPASFPSGGISIGSNNNIDIDINVYYPTDESGQPITDESGETVTETYYVTDTTPTDVVYKFTIPTLPNLDRYSDTLPPMNLAQFESGINFIFSVADGIFTDTGFLPVIIVTLSLCALCYVIWKIGG